MAFAHDLDEHTQAFHSLVLDLGDLILDELENVLQDLVLRRLVAKEISRILPDLRHEILQTHEPVVLVWRLHLVYETIHEILFRHFAERT